MKKNKTGHTNHSDPQQNSWYPRHASDRADELIDELSPEQVLRLYNALGTKTPEEWFCWLEDDRAKIEKYDCLTAAERKAQLHNGDESEPLLLHHACVFVELWRVRIENEYFSFRGNEHLPDSQNEQRAMMLSVLAAYSNAHPADFWPFDHRDIHDGDPFHKTS